PLGESRNILAMVLPGATGRRAFTGRQLIEATALRIDDGARRSMWTNICRIRHSVEILIGRTNLDVLEHRLPGVGRDRGGIDDLQVAANRRAIYYPQLQIAELQRRAFQARRRRLGKVNYRVLPSAVLENSQAHGDRVARVEVPGKRVKGQESSKGD